MTLKCQLEIPLWFDSLFVFQKTPVFVVDDCYVKSLQRTNKMNSKNWPYNHIMILDNTALKGAEVSKQR